MEKHGQPYDLNQATAEASQLQRRIEAGEAEGYPEAEKLVDTEQERSEAFLREYKSALLQSQETERSLLRLSEQLQAKRPDTGTAVTIDIDVEELLKSEIPPDISQQALLELQLRENKCRTAIDQLKRQQDAFDQEKASLRKDIAQHVSAIQEINRGLISGFLRRRELAERTRETDSLSSRYNNLLMQDDTAARLIRELEYKLRDLEQAQDSGFDQLVSAETQKSADRMGELDYSGMFETSLRTYIDDTVLPVLDRLTSENGYSPEEAAEVREKIAGQLESYARHGFEDRLGNKQSELESSFHETIRQFDNSYELQQKAHPILRQEFGRYFKRIMDYMQAESQAALFPELKKDHRASGAVASGRGAYYGNSHSSADNMVIWNTFRQSAAGRSLPDGVVDKIDHGIRQGIRANAYRDRNGDWIDQLQECLDTESFTTLVLIQSARKNGYSHDHAGPSLRNMMKNPGWPELAARIKEKHPELDLTALESRVLGYDWESRGAPDIEDLTESLAQSVYESQGPEDELRYLAAESLPSKMILESLTEKNRLSPDEAATLLETESRLKSAKQVWEAAREKEPEGSGEYARDYHSAFLKHFRSALADSISRGRQQQSNQEDSVNQLQNLAILGRKINEHADEPAVREFLGDHSRVTQIAGLRTNTNFFKKHDPEPLNIYMEAWKTVPEILTNDKLATQLFQGIFLNPNARESSGETYRHPDTARANQHIAFLKKLLENYGRHQQLLQLLMDQLDQENLPAELKANPNQYELLQQAHRELRAAPEGDEQSERIGRINNVLTNIGEDERLIWQLMQLANGDILTQERILELPLKGVNLAAGLSGNNLALECPRMVLEKDDTLPFISEMSAGGLDGLDPATDIALGRQALRLNRETGQPSAFRYFSNLISAAELTRLQSMDPEAPAGLNQENWQLLLGGFLEQGKLPEKWRTAIGEIFKGAEAKKMCLDLMFENWQAYLEAGQEMDLPFSLMHFPQRISENGGAGHLSQLESFGNFLKAYRETLTRKTTVPRTIREIATGMSGMEKRFDGERWSNGDRVVFYNISADILGSAPSLFSSYLELFEKLNRAELAEFTDEIYPLHRVLLMLSEKSGYGQATHEPKKLAGMRSKVTDLSEQLGAVAGSKKEFLKAKKDELIQNILEAFKQRFGIIKVPDTVTPEFVRSLKNVSLYLSNLHDRNAQKESVLGFYLALMINGRWEDFRQGAAIDPAEYLDADKAAGVKTLLERREQSNPLTAEALGIPAEQLPEFQRLLQQESQNVAVGDVETVDVKVANITLNVRELEDPDLYPDPLDRARLQLLHKFGHKAVGAGAAKIFREMSGKPVPYSEQEASVRQAIEELCTRQGLAFQPETIKKVFQEEMKPLATLVNILSFIRESGAEQEVESLRELLVPAENIVDIFNRLGEDFSTSSGAMALSQDLAYLENLIVKRSDDLKPEEKAVLTEYLEKIKAQMTKLQDIYEQIVEKLSGLRKGGLAHANDQLQKKLEQIDSIIRHAGQEQLITSTMTGNLDTVIENMRACLACTTAGCNNDTNTTFGDPNKFYLYSQGESRDKASIADEIVFLEPVVRPDGTREMSFVFDQVYETKTPAVLLNHFEAVLKKFKAIKKKFPDCKLSIFLPVTAGASVGLSPEILRQKLGERIGKGLAAANETVTVEVAESAMGDHYIEFGGDARSAGPRTITGVSVKSK